MKNTDNTDNSIGWINWIDKVIAEKNIKLYEYQHFSNLQQIGTGAFGKVYRVNWKNSEQFLALKSFFYLNDNTVKELVREVIKKYHDFILL